MRRFIGALMLVVFLGGCAKTVYLDENGNEIVPPQTEKVEYLHDSGERFEIVEDFGSLQEVRDVTTGVHYYFYRISSTSGVSGLTPVYASDGVSVRVTKK